MKNYFDENDIVLRKALLYIPATDDNIEFCEEDGNLSLIKEEAIEVEVEMMENEKEIEPYEMYDILLHGNIPATNIAGEWLTLKPF